MRLEATKDGDVRLVLDEGSSAYVTCDHANARVIVMSRDEWRAVAAISGLAPAGAVSQIEAERNIMRDAYVLASARVEASLAALGRTDRALEAAQKALGEWHKLARELLQYGDDIEATSEELRERLESVVKDAGIIADTARLDEKRAEGKVDILREKLHALADFCGVVRAEGEPPLTSLEIIERVELLFGAARNERNLRVAEIARLGALGPVVDGLTKERDALRALERDMLRDRREMRERVAKLAHALNVTTSLYGVDGSWMTTLLLDAIIEAVEKRAASTPITEDQLRDRDTRIAMSAEARAAEWQCEAESAKKLLALSRAALQRSAEDLRLWRVWASVYSWVNDEADRTAISRLIDKRETALKAIHDAVHAAWDKEPPT